MMEKDIYKIAEKISQYNQIIILCHLIPDHDSVGATNALKKAINLNFSNKEVRIYSQASSFFNQFVPFISYEDMNQFKKPLIICLDCANIERLSWNEYNSECEVIKLDHHPPLDNYGDINVVDVNVSSTCELLWTIFRKLNWNLNKDIATLIYLGIIGDTGRFLFKNTTSSTYQCVSELFRYNISPQTELYPYLYATSIKDIKTKACLTKNLLMLDGLGVVLLTEKMIKKDSLNILDISKFTNHFGSIKELKIWVVIVAQDNYYKCSIRSKNEIINDIAQKYNGGGHMYASGCKIVDANEIFALISDLYLRQQKNKKMLNLSCLTYLSQQLNDQEWNDNESNV